MIPLSTSLIKKKNYLEKAIELDPNSANTQYAIALDTIWTEWEWEKGEEAFINSLEQYPIN